jgi:hypothetical protein
MGRYLRLVHKGGGLHERTHTKPAELRAYRRPLATKPRQLAHVARQPFGWRPPLGGFGRAESVGNLDGEEREGGGAELAALERGGDLIVQPRLDEGLPSMGEIGGDWGRSDEMG